MSENAEGIGKTEFVGSAPSEMKMKRYRAVRGRSSVRPACIAGTRHSIGLNPLLFMVLCAITVSQVGCGGGSEPIEPAPSEPDSSEAGTIDGPDTAVERALAAVRDGRPDDVWRLMPTSYQKDVSSLVHGFAKRIDADSWNRTFALARRTADLAERRRAWFLSHPSLDDPGGQLPVEGNLVREHWDDAARLLNVLATSDLADWEKLVALDVESFLAGTGRALLAESGGLTASLADVEVELVSIDGDRAQLRLTGAEAEPRTHDYVRVEGKWVPAAVAESWEDSMANATTSVEAMTVDTEAWTAALDAWEEALVKAESAGTEAALHEVVDAYVRTKENESRPPVRASTEGAVVVVSRVLTATEEEQLQLVLNAAAADPDLAVSIGQRKGETTHFEVSHVGPLAAYAERLGAADGVTVESTDAENRVVTVRFDGG